MAYRPDQDSSDYKAGYEEGFADALKPPPNYDKERAVIEAARKYLKLSKSPPELYVGFLEPEVAAYLNLREALRALDNAELDPCQ